MQLTVGPHFAGSQTLFSAFGVTAISCKTGTPATSKRKKYLFLRISLSYYLFLPKNGWFKLVKLNFAHKVHVVNRL